MDKIFGFLANYWWIILIVVVIIAFCIICQKMKCDIGGGCECCGTPGCM